MKGINMTPEVVEILNDLCSDLELDDFIVNLGDAEYELQEAAENEGTEETNHLFRLAYHLKKKREKLERLEKALGYDPNR